MGVASSTPHFVIFHLGFKVHLSFEYIKIASQSNPQAIKPIINIVSKKAAKVKGIAIAPKIIPFKINHIISFTFQKFFEIRLWGFPIVNIVGHKLGESSFSS